ncbi:MAG: glycoside hydrolase family 127 protein [Dysgonamonadaceae bacterium]|jgi:DUF1680 family protein|nr:glycoside hydrolase family 127 protein [Dysgonamonadaceae bacterium]
MKNIYLLLVIVLAMMPNRLLAQATLKVEDQQFPLPPGSIRLSGFLENDIQNFIEHWNKGVVPYAEMADFFRNGRRQFALGEMWGKAVRSACMFYRYTQDPELKRMIDATVNDLLSTQQKNGSISCVRINQQPDDPNGDLWERKYAMLGLEEYYQWVNPDPRVLESLKRQADCIISQIGDAPKAPITEQGWSETGIESSSLLEPFMRLYNRTGEKRYLEFATYIVDNGASKGSNIFQQAINNVEPAKMGLPYPKAYEMTSVFEGLVEYYRATGDPKYKQAIQNYFNNVKNREITIVGNGGGHGIGGEGWNNMAFEQSDPDIVRMMETCVGVTWMKFCSQMMRLTGDPAAMDEIERYVYNGLIGAMKPHGDGFSYCNLLNGHKTNNTGWGWDFGDLRVTCCNLNGPMGLAYIPFVAVTTTKNGPVINLYNAATVGMTTPSGNPLNLSIETDFPQSGKVSVKVNPEKPESFDVKLRIPSWSARTSVKVNGAAQPVTAGTYASIKRQWKAGDTIEIVLEMRCRLLLSSQCSNPQGNNRQAVVYGPIVLSRDENTDEHYNQPVKIKADINHIVKAVKTKPTLASTRMEFVVPSTTGSIRMIDYASVNNWNDTYLCTWMTDVPTLETIWEKSSWIEVSNSGGVWGDGHDASLRNAFDDNKNTCWHSKIGVMMPITFVMDMRKERPAIKGFKIWNRQDDHGNEPRHVRFSVSSNNNDWTTVLEIPEMSQSWETELDYPTTRQAGGRYLKVEIGSHYRSYPWCYFGEITPY